MRRMPKEREVTRIYKWKECQRKEKSQEFLNGKNAKRKEKSQEFINENNIKGKRSHKNF